MLDRSLVIQAYRAVNETRSWINARHNFENWARYTTINPIIIINLDSHKLALKNSTTNSTWKYRSRIEKKSNFIKSIHHSLKNFELKKAPLSTYIILLNDTCGNDTVNHLVSAHSCHPFQRLLPRHRPRTAKLQSRSASLGKRGVVRRSIYHAVILSPERETSASEAAHRGPPLSLPMRPSWSSDLVE